MPGFTLSTLPSQAQTLLRWRSLSLSYPWSNASSLDVGFIWAAARWCLERLDWFQALWVTVAINMDIWLNTLHLHPRLTELYTVYIQSMEVSKNGGTPSHHPQFHVFFHEINHPSILGYPIGNPQMDDVKPPVGPWPCSHWVSKTAMLTLQTATLKGGAARSQERGDGVRKQKVC